MRIKGSVGGKIERNAFYSENGVWERSADCREVAANEGKLCAAERSVFVEGV